MHTRLRILSFTAATGLAALIGCGIVLAQDVLRVDVNLVNVFVTVQDDQGRFVTDLKPEDFVIYDDDDPQPIAVFEKEDAVQSSIGILLDSSGSMVDLLPFMRTGVRDFTRRLSSNDDLFVVSFGTRVRTLHEPPQTQKQLEDSMNLLRPYGTSLLYDAMLYGMRKIEPSGKRRKALVVFSDGYDNGSTGEQREVVAEAQRTGVLVYFIAIGNPIMIDRITVDSLARVSGGRVLYVPKTESVSDAMEQILFELSNQYYLGYYMPRRPGLHNIRVAVPGRNVTVRAKTGYLENEL